MPIVNRDMDNEFELLAEFVARKYGNPLINPQGLPFVSALLNIDDALEDMLLTDPIAWSDRVNDYLYGMR